MIRIQLPAHLKTLAKVPGEVQLDVSVPTLGSALSELETRFPVLRGAIRDHGTLKRRAFVRYYACEEDLSLSGPDTPLPEAVLRGEQPLMIVGALAGG